MHYVPRSVPFLVDPMLVERADLSQISVPVSHQKWQPVVMLER